MPAGVDVLSLRDIGFEQEIEETGVTLEENSMIKARTVADFINGGMSASLNGVDGVFACAGSQDRDGELRPQPRESLAGAQG